MAFSRSLYVLGKTRFPFVYCEGGGGLQRATQFSVKEKRLMIFAWSSSPLLFFQALSACLRHKFVDEGLFVAAASHMAELLHTCNAADHQSERRQKKRASAA